MPACMLLSTVSGTSMVTDTLTGAAASEPTSAVFDPGHTHVENELWLEVAGVLTV